MKFKLLIIFLNLLYFVPNVNLLFSNNEPDKLNKNKWKLVWSDEFDVSGLPDTLNWNYEYGFVRNEEFQWYKKENAFCENGLLIIEGRKENVLNPEFNSTSNNWRLNREFAEYTSSSLNTRGKREFMFGRFEIRARIDTAMGLWPAIWTLGVNGEWPSNGEIDIMESYPVDNKHQILANVATGTQKRYVAKWNSTKIPLDYFLKKDSAWTSKFHVWRMDWDRDFIKLYLDNELMNEIDLSVMINPDGSQPFHQPHYILLNLAIGGQNGGNPSKTIFPTRYEIDYVRVYQ